MKMNINAVNEKSPTVPVITGVTAHLGRDVFCKRNQPWRSLVPWLGICLLGMALACGAAQSDPEEQADFLRRSRAEHGPPDDMALVWREVGGFRFDDPSELERMRPIEGEWRISGDELIAESGDPDRNRTVLIMPVKGDHLRIAFDATLEARSDGRVGDICIRIADPGSGSFRNHYAAITAQYWNQASVIYRRNIPIARTEWSPIVPGRTHRVMLQFSRGRRDHLRYWVDGRVVVDGWHAPDSVDLAGTWIGISSYDTRLRIANLTVHVGEPPGTD